MGFPHLGMVGVFVGFFLLPFHSLEDEIIITPS